jgi:hypothetical protein
MTASPQHDFPALCVEVGLNCESCTEASARELSASCPGLPGKLVSQLFVQIHVYPACLRMHGNFARAYADASMSAVAAVA